MKKMSKLFEAINKAKIKIQSSTSFLTTAITMRL